MECSLPALMPVAFEGRLTSPGLSAASPVTSRPSAPFALLPLLKTRPSRDKNNTCSKPHETSAMKIPPMPAHMGFGSPTGASEKLDATPS